MSSVTFVESHEKTNVMIVNDMHIIVAKSSFKPSINDILLNKSLVQFFR